MPEARPVDLNVLRRRYAEVRAMQKAVRGLLEQLSLDDMTNSPWPSGRNCWGTLHYWLTYRQRFLDIVEGKPHPGSDFIKGRPRYAPEEAWAEWDAFTRRADHIMETFTEERWNSDVDWWADFDKSRRIKAWEMFVTHFANRLDMSWTHVLEDICTMGHRQDLESLIGVDWYYYREGEHISDYHPSQHEPE